MTPFDAERFRMAQDWRRLRLLFLGGGVLLLAASIAGAFFSPGDFFRAYLIGYLFWSGLALGSLGFLMMQYLTGGAWGVVARRILEAATRTFPLLAVLFLPVGFGIRYLYDWARPELVRHEAVLRHRSAYMNPGFFMGRAAIYLALWITLAFLVNRWSAEQDRDRTHLSSRLVKLSAPGLILFLFSVTFASIDWAESLETHWSSTMWGFMFIAADGLLALAFLVIVMTVLSRRTPMARILKPSHFHDIGKMLFANLMLWAYFAFCQYLIVWSGNLETELHYYLSRTGTSWGWLGLCLVVVEFLIPALLLLNRGLKRNPVLLSAVAALLLAMSYLDLVWVVLPSYYKQGFRVQWMDVLTPFGIGGIWLWAFLRELPRFPLLPVNAPELEEALVHESS